MRHEVASDSYCRGDVADPVCWRVVCAAVGVADVSVTACYLDFSMIWR